LQTSNPDKENRKPVMSDKQSLFSFNIVVDKGGYVTVNMTEEEVSFTGSWQNGVESMSAERSSRGFYFLNGI